MAEQVLDWDAAPKAEDRTFTYFVHGVRTLWKLTATEHVRIALAGGILVAGNTLQLVAAVFVKNIFDHATHLAHPVPLAQAVTLMASIAPWFALWAFALITPVLMKRLVQDQIFLRAVIRLENTWPVMAYRKLLALSLGYHEQENTGKKIAKISKGVEKLVGILVDSFWSLLPALFSLVISIGVLMTLDWRLGLIFAIPVMPAAWLNLRCYAQFQPVWEQWERKKEESVGYLCQGTINMQTVQASVAEPREDDRHAAVRADMEHLDLRASLSSQKYFLGIELLMYGFYFLTFVFGMLFYFVGMTSMGTLVYVVMTSSGTLGNLRSIIDAYSRMMRNLVAAERMHALLNEEVTVANEAPGVIPELTSGMLAFENVTLKHAGKEEPLFASFSLTIPPGQMIAFVGRSGSGKSSLANLLRRVYDPTSGAVTIDGTNVRHIDRDWYRLLFAHVAQDVQVLECSIRENIVYGVPGADDTHVAQSVRAACLDEDLSDGARFPNGLDTQVGERGVKLSGGERQRVGIARAYMALLAGDAKVLVLDEATSSLDSMSERVVQSFIEQLRREKKITIVAIAHRLSTIKKADRICVLSHGVIVETGTHDELIQQGGEYSQLVKLQELD